MSAITEIKNVKDKVLGVFKNKQSMLDLAELFDAYRVWPRMLVAGYGHLVYQTSIWFMSLENPTTQQVAFISTVVGAAAIVFGMYTNSGRKWQ